MSLLSDEVSQDVPDDQDTAALSARVQSLLSDLAEEVAFLCAEEAGPRYCRDWQNLEGVPSPVVRPASPKVLAEVVARLGRAGIRMVPQGGGSGLVGAAAPQKGEVVISTERMCEIEEVNLLSCTMRVQAGVTLQAVQETAEAHGLFYPVDLGARGSCQLGGNIATNAGGNRVLQYGMTRASVLGLEVVLADGRVISRLSEVVKDNAGYDLKQLFIGSEGTLGIVSRATLRLQPLPRGRHTVLLGLNSLPQVLDALMLARRAFGPSLTSFEVMWQDYFSYVYKDLGIGRDPFDGRATHHVLLEISSFDHSEERDQARLEEALVEMAEVLCTDQVAIAQSLKEASDFWAVRDASGEVARSMGEYLSFDISIPTHQLTVALTTLSERLLAIDPEIRKVTYGHLGDGNLHLLVACTGEVAELVEQAVLKVLAPLGGSISAEHGIGLHKRAMLVQARPAVELEVMRQVKETLDPHNLLSRGRVFGPLEGLKTR